MSSDNKDLLNLCRLNLMEENIINSPAPDRNNAMAAIDFKKRMLATKILGETEPAHASIMERHIKANT